MIFLKKYGFYFLLMGVISDFLTPYILGMFYTEMDQMKMVISILSEVGSPVRPAFLIWSVISGSFFVLALPAVYFVFQCTSKVLAGFLTICIGIYGIGDCIFTGLFSINTEQTAKHFSTVVHNVGSGVGYAGVYGLARIPTITSLPVLSQLGFCQRMSFFFNYLPVAILAITQLNQRPL